MPKAHGTIVVEPERCKGCDLCVHIRYTGMVGLGALIGGTQVVGVDAVRSCLEETLPSYRHHMIPANLQALQRGAACAGSHASFAG